MIAWSPHTQYCPPWDGCHRKCSIFRPTSTTPVCTITRCATAGSVFGLPTATDGGRRCVPEIADFPASSETSADPFRCTALAWARRMDLESCALALLAIVSCPDVPFSEAAERFAFGPLRGVTLRHAGQGPNPCDASGGV